MQRQQVLVLYLADSNLDAPVVAWSIWDGTGDDEHMAGDHDAPPYGTGLEALRDGWRLFQASQLEQHVPGAEYRTGYLKYEFFFEKLAETAGLARLDDTDADEEDEADLAGRSGGGYDLDDSDAKEDE